MRHTILAVILGILVCFPAGAESIVRDLQLCPDSPNCVSSRSDEANAHFVEPFLLKGEVTQAWKRVREAVLALPRSAAEQEGPTYLHAVVRSFLFRFPDDVELALNSAARRVDVRSASRYGYSDLGVNSRRIEGLRETLRREGVVE